MKSFFNLSDNVNQLAIIGAAAIILITLFVVGKYFKDMKGAKTDAPLAEDNWDGIGEYENDLPVGWAACFVGVILFALYYFFVGYPLNSYSQIGEYNDEVKAYNKKFENKFANADQTTLKAMGEGLFLVECAPCHGANGEGISGKAANLHEWGSEKAIADVIKNGSKGMGYPMGEMTAGLVDDNASKAVVAYIAQEVSGIKKSANANLVADGKSFETTNMSCQACHGPDYKGMDGQAPDLTKYGTAEFVVDVLNHGKAGTIGVMPNFGDGRLSDIQKRAVGEYVISLSKE